MTGRASGFKISAAFLECTFPPLLFLHCRPFSCLRRTWWDGVKRDVWREGSPGRMTGKPTGKARFPLPELTVTGFHYGRAFPLAELTGPSTRLVETHAHQHEWKLVTRQLGPLTRAVNSGSGNRTLVCDTVCGVFR